MLAELEQQRRSAMEKDRDKPGKEETPEGEVAQRRSREEALRWQQGPHLLETDQ